MSWGGIYILPLQLFSLILSYRASMGFEIPIASLSSQISKINRLYKYYAGHVTTKEKKEIIVLFESVFESIEHMEPPLPAHHIEKFQEVVPAVISEMYIELGLFYSL